MHAWTFTWDAFLALATLLVVLFTARLAARTSTLARATADDIAGQHRPILTTRPDLGATYSVPEQATLVLPVTTRGPVPALDVRAFLQPVGLPPQEWNNGALPSREVVEIKSWDAPRPNPGETVAVEVMYRDLDGVHYTSSIFIKCIDKFALPATAATFQIVDVVITSSPRCRASPAGGKTGSPQSPYTTPSVRSRIAFSPLRRVRRTRAPVI